MTVCTEVNKRAECRRTAPGWSPSSVHPVCSGNHIPPTHVPAADHCVAAGSDRRSLRRLGIFPWSLMQRGARETWLTHVGAKAPSLVPRSQNSSEGGFAEQGRNAEGCSREEGGRVCRCSSERQQARPRSEPHPPRPCGDPPSHS